MHRTGEISQFTKWVRDPPDGLVLNCGSLLKGGAHVWKPVIAAVNGHAVTAR